MNLRRQTIRRAVVALCVVGMAAAAYHATRGQPPNVVVIVVDTLRADRLGCYGNRRGLTPFLDQLAQRGVVFLHTSAASSWTAPSVASLFTSRYPSQHHVVSFGSRLADQEVTFAERLQRAHYLGAGFSANFRLLERLGYAQGFRFWRSDAQKAGGLSGAQLRAEGLDWLDSSQRSSGQPLLLYFHFMEPHSPYDPPEPFRSRFAVNDDGSSANPGTALRQLVDLSTEGRRWTPQDVRPFERLYDAEVATVDDQIRLLLGELERRGVLDDAIVVLTADHGEEFGEHGGIEHGRTLYEESIRVPLIVVGPGIAAGQRVDEDVSLVDVAPTLLDLLGLSAEARFEGRSLLPLLPTGADGSRAPADILFELAPTGMRGAPQVHEGGIRRGQLKLLLRTDGGRESFDLATDPDEQHANPPAIAQEVSGLASALGLAGERLRGRAAAAIAGEVIDDATKEKLRALGYRY